MRKIILMTMLATVAWAAKAQDTKPYEQKMSQIEAQYKTLEADYRAFGKKDPTTFTDAEKARLNEIMMRADSLDKVQKATVLEIVEKFKTTKFPAKYVADIMYDVEYDQLKALCDPKTGYYNEPEMTKVKQLFDSYKLRQPGSMYKDLTMDDLNGKQVKLSQWVGKGKYVLVDFWASWCGPCRMLSPVIDEIAEETPALKVGKVNVDDEPELAAAFGVQSIPTVVIIKDGEIKEISVGYKPKDEIIELL